MPDNRARTALANAGALGGGLTGCARGAFLGGLTGPV